MIVRHFVNDLGFTFVWEDRTEEEGRGFVRDKFLLLDEKVLFLHAHMID